MKTPLRIHSQDGSPHHKASISRILVHRYGIGRKEAAGMLGVTEAAVSQYLFQRRATKRNLGAFKSRHFEELVGRATGSIASSPGEIEIMKVPCNCCMKVRAGKLLCEMHGEISTGLNNCDFCLTFEDKEAAGGHEKSYIEHKNSQTHE